MNPESRNVQVSGESVRYYDYGGTGPHAFLMLHGYNFNSLVWKDLAFLQCAVIKGLHVIALDIPGFPNSVNRFHADEDQVSGIIDRIMSTESVSSVTVMGASAGGTIAMSYARESSRPVDSMILVGAVGLEEGGIRSFNFPLLGIWGSLDRISPPDKARMQFPASGASRFVVLEGAGHPCYLDRPVEFSDAICSFLEEIVGRL